MLYLWQRVLSWIAEILVSFLILFEAIYKTDFFKGLSGENLGGSKVAPNDRYCFSDWPLGILLRILKDFVLQTTNGALHLQRQTIWLLCIEVASAANSSEAKPII
jgi:hypothetical protein